jgi:hypothetical protein
MHPARPRRRASTVSVAFPAALAALLLVAACSGEDAATETVPSTTRATPTTVAPSTTTTALATTTTTTSSTTTTTTTLPAVPRQPLTGVPLADGEQPIDRPALAVKIDNAGPSRRDHSGLAVADIVYEEIVEANITRFAAVFHSQGSDPVGPIRSGRSQDVALLTSLREPLFAWSGGNPGVTRLIAESIFVDLNAVRGGAGYYRGPGQQPHDLYNSTDRLWQQTPEGHPGAPPQQFEYVRPGDAFRGEPTAGFELAMRSIDVVWTWDTEQRRFLRDQEGRPHVDAVHGPIGATNVIVLVVEYRPSQIDARSPEAQTISEGGPAWVFSEGQVREGRWIRLAPTDPFTFVSLDGDPILLTPGNTWVELAEGIPTDDPANPGVALQVRPPA